VIIHADEVAASDRPGGYGEDTAKEEGEEEEGKLWSGKARVETFVVGQDVLSGERLQWIVGSGKYKAEMLLPDEEGGEESKEGCLISETVVPGFEFEDHDFLKRERAEALLTVEQVEEMGWMLRRD
jgi:predicted cupin superfamily sugar epimerase